MDVLQIMKLFVDIMHITIDDLLLEFMHDVLAAEIDRHYLLQHIHHSSFILAYHLACFAY